MMTLIWVLVGLACYVAGGRTVFWALTRADQPRTLKWDCGRSERDSAYNYDHHRHSYRGCTQSRDVPGSRNRRIAMTYFWPVFLPLTIAALTAASAGVGVHKAMTQPITTPAERRERRLALEKQVAAAEAESDKAKVVQEAANAASDWARLAYDAEMRKRQAEVRQAIAETDTVLFGEVMNPLGGKGALCGLCSGCSSACPCTSAAPGSCSGR